MLLIDADALKERLIEILGNLDCKTQYCKDCEFCEDIDRCTRRQKEIVADKLIANGVIIPVRCKDCKYNLESVSISNCRCELDGDVWEDNDFCSYGKRRDNTDD